MKKYIPIALAFLAGAGVGIAGTYFYLDKKYVLVKPELLDIDEMHEYKDEDTHRYFDENTVKAYDSFTKNYTQPMSEALARLREKPSLDSIIGQMSIEEAEEKDEEQRQMMFEETPTDEDLIESDGLKDEDDTMPFQIERDPENPRPPFVVPEEVYIVDYADWEHEYCAYYAEDDVLCDDQGKVMDIEKTIGAESLGKFDENDMLFVVNEYLGLAYEVEYLNRSYQEDILGIYDDEEEDIPIRKRFQDEDD